MKVALIDYTGIGSVDQMFAARLLAYTKNTRLEQGMDTRIKFQEMNRDDLMKELDYIAKTIRSSWEFIHYTFEITGVTRAFTHQFVRSRNWSFAQQSQRAMNLTGFETRIPETVRANSSLLAKWHRVMELIDKTYDAFQIEGIPNQDCRGILPTNITTSIIAGCNLRSFADTVAKRGESLRAQGEYREVVELMAQAVLKVHPWVEPFIDPDRLKTPALTKLLSEQLGQAAAIDKPAINEAIKELELLKGTWG